MALACELLKQLEYTCIKGSVDREVGALVYDSRKIEKGCIFVCIEGTKTDGHSFAVEAAEKGAAVLVTQKDVEVPKESDIAIVRTEDTRYALAFLSAAYFGHPAERMKIIGITGTKGKTTTTYLVKSILADAGCDTVVMEVSSQGLMMHRTQGFVFDIGIFTNIEPDHIGPNEHTDFEDYMACKGLLFRQCKVGIVNCDDAHWQNVTKGHTCALETYGFSEHADLQAYDMRLVKSPGSLGVDFAIRGLADLEVETNTPGRFSVYNALTAVAICRHFGVSGEDIKEALLHAHVKGRIEIVKVSPEFTLMIDYAHNAMALESLLTTLREYEPHRLVCLFGCGGNRSRLRRYEMGEVSGRLADLTVITSDNPRFEEPQAIIDDIKTGIGKTDGKYVEICDRKEAIRYVIEHGEPGDIIVLAGKGHEDYQEIRGKKYPMDERVLIVDILKEKGRDLL